MSTISARVGCALREEVGRRDQDARRAEAALQRVMTAEGLLQRPPRQALDRAQLAAVHLHGEHQARAHRDAVELDRARAADPVLAADVRAGQAELVAQEVAQQEARLDLGAPVDCRSRGALITPPPARTPGPARARRPSRSASAGTRPSRAGCRTGRRARSPARPPRAPSRGSPELLRDRGRAASGARRPRRSRRALP